MINEIKTIIQNYINNAKLCCLITGTVTRDGIQISDKLILPLELITGNLKHSIAAGQKVRLLRDHGGKVFYILEVMNDEPDN
ncbi:hypothetical protein HNQ56_004426 [Anaerotaenia torta]|uniref:DNA helicase n=1 Tax=Anaerotaenia torta TaxID=433293 RepID=UPI003D1FE245